MRIAIIGYGNIGKIHLTIAQKYFADIALCDINYNVIKDVQGVKKYVDFCEMLDLFAPNIVHICTPHYLHSKMIIEALKRDINVLCEKPLCISKKEIQDILRAEKESKTQLGICFQNRYNKQNIFLKEYLADKKVLDAFGCVVWNRDKNYYSQDKWRGKVNTEGGGTLINQALHTLDLLQWIVGMPNKVTASISNLKHNDCIEVEDTASIDCEGNVHFSFFASNNGKTDFPVELTIKTVDDIVHVYQNKVITKDKIYQFEDNAFYYSKYCYGNGHEALIGEFYDCVKNDRKFPIDVLEASKVVKIVLAAYKSNGKEVMI